jgi:hypothetical protein
VSQRAGLNTIADPNTQRAIKLLMDRLATLEAQALTIGSVSKVLTAPLHAGNHPLTSVADPVNSQDAVTLRYLQRYVDSRAPAAASKAVNAIPPISPQPPGTTPPTAPGAPGGPPVTPPSIPGTPPAGSGTLTHGFDLSIVKVYNSPLDIANWAVTGTISQVTVRPDVGVQIICSTTSPPGASPPAGPGKWPQGPTAADASPGVQYTVWMLVQIAGVWYTSGFVLCWIGRAGTGAGGGFPVGANFAAYWAYDSRWGPMNGYSPPPGTQVGFFVSAGIARGQTGVSSVKERSEVVLLNLPDVAGATYV